MDHGTKKTIVFASVIALAAGAGCATHHTPHSEAEAQLMERQEKIKTLQTSLEERDRTLKQQQNQIQQLSMAAEQGKKIDVAAPPPSSFRGSEMLPPSAKPGECYARVFVPPVYRTETLQLLKREASERVEVVPAKYEWVEERVLVKEASTRLEEIPATYEWVEERVLDREAHTVWKKGRGLIERVDNTTGEIMCLVEVPATYKTVRTRVLKTPATTREVQIPAQYSTIKVRKLVSSPQTKRIEIPAEHQTITKTHMVSDGHMEWRSVLCETNATRQLVSSIQRALEKKGHSPGPIDGIIGSQTMAALSSFQKEKSLPSGRLTLATLDALGVTASR